MNSSPPRMNVRSLPDSAALLRRSNQWKPIPNFARWPGVSKTAKLLAQFPMQPEERWYQGKASPFSFARSSSKSIHVRFVAGDPSVNCSLGNVSHGHRDGRLQEKTSLAFLNKNHGVAKLIETQFASEGRGQRKRATFAKRNCGCHAAMLHRSNAVLKCKLISAPTSMRRSTSWRPDWPRLRGEARGLLRPVNRDPIRETGPYLPARRESRSK